MNVLDLFSGIGGFSLGLERAGMRTVAFCECNDYCRRVLAKHWPDVPCYDDVRTLTAARLAADGIIPDVADAESRRTKQQESIDAKTFLGSGLGASGGSIGRDIASRIPISGRDAANGQSNVETIDLICGGFPCQDISVAGKGAGIGGERSGLWSEYARIIGEVRPRYVIVENVAALLGRGMGRVLGDLSALGYDAEWKIISAADVGAPHLRRRVWIVADAISIAGRPCGLGDTDEGPRGRNAGGSSIGADVADPNGAGRQQQWQCLPIREELAAAQCGDWWQFEPAMGELVDGLSDGLVRFEGRTAKGIPDRVNKFRALGNAVVPQIPELIGRAIMKMEAAT